MNTHAEYRRHSYQPPEPPTAQEAVESAANELARHRDPSLQPDQAASGMSQKRVAWVRPTELGSYLGPVVGRGIDAQSELVRRARRTPAMASRATRGAVPTRSAPTVPTEEGMGL